MTANDLIAEGERLSRPCLYLTGDEKSGRLTGIWGGRGIVKPPLGPFMHRLTIDCELLRIPEISKGLLAIYSNEEDYSTGAVVHNLCGNLSKAVPRIDCSPQRELPSSPADIDGFALFGRESTSFPPIDAVFEYGGPRVKAWLESLGLPKPENWDPYFEARSSADAYEDEYRRRCPLFDPKNEVAAQVGGWHVPWPDGDWFELLKDRLLVWTFWNSEPWLEVWMEGLRSFKVLQRIT